MADASSPPPFVAALGEVVIAIDDCCAEGHTPARWKQILAPCAVDIDTVAFGELASKAGPLTAATTIPSESSAWTSLKQSRITIAQLQDKLEADASIDEFRVLPENLFPVLNDVRRLLSGGIEEWYIQDFAIDTASRLHRRIAVLANAADFAHDLVILRSELQCALTLMIFMLVDVVLPSGEPYDGEICVTILSAVQSKARVIHANVEGGHFKIFHSRYFDTTQAEETHKLLVQAQLDAEHTDDPETPGSPSFGVQQILPTRGHTESYPVESLGDGQSQ